MDHTQLKNILEAVLFAATQPLSVDRMLMLFLDGAQPTREEILAALEQLRADYAARSIELQEVSSGFRFQARPEYAPWIARLWEERPQRYSRALLETLALIAYRQPITRAEIEDIRGVAVSSHIVKTLEERGWVRVVGHKDVPGRPSLLATTREFLDYFNMKSLDQLPPLADIRNLDAILTAHDAGAAEDGSEPDESPLDTVVPFVSAAAHDDVSSASEGADDTRPTDTPLH